MATFLAAARLRPRSAQKEESFVTQVYFIKPAVIAPIVATAAITAIGLTCTHWWLIGIPFAVVGTMCGQPNLNLADGCLAWLAVGIGLLISLVHRDIGSAIAASSVCGLLLGALEKALRAVPYTDMILQSSRDQSRSHTLRTDNNDGRIVP